MAYQATSTQQQQSSATTEHLDIPGESSQVVLVHPDQGFSRTGWVGEALNDFENRMLDDAAPFPCIFGVDAVKKATLRYAFVPAAVGDDISPLAKVLRQFVHEAPALGKRTSLVTFFEADGASRDLNQWRDHFWSILQRLHIQDTAPWPAEISVDPETPTWEFSFAGMPFFVVANTPAHQRRKSRQFSCLAVTFQPRFVFDDLAATSVQGRNARKVIRDRLVRYDDLPPAPDLGNFGSPDNREWVQYFMSDDAKPVPAEARCPIRMDPNHNDEHVSLGTSPVIAHRAMPLLPGVFTDLLPAQGSYELQHDQPGKVHDWHRHSVEEELFVLEGSLELFWSENKTRRTARVQAGSLINLPAELVHGSQAGPLGAIYIIRPMGGRAAETAFLPVGAHPEIGPTVDDPISLGS